MTAHKQHPFLQRLSRRKFVAASLAPVIAVGLSGLTRPGRALATTPATLGSGPITPRIETVSHSGLAFRSGTATGVQVPGLGGAMGGLSPERPGAQYTSPVIESNFPASHVGVSWETDGIALDKLALQVRTGLTGTEWTPWRAVIPELHGHDETVRETFGALVPARAARFIQYRITFGSAEPEPAVIQQVRVTAINAGNSRAGGDGTQAFRAPARSNRLGPLGFVDRVIPREEWGADESLRFKDGVDQWPRAFVAPKFLAVHHTATDNEYADPAAEIRAIYAYHTVTQGFGDIGYHLLIDNRGQVYEGRRGREGASPADREIVSADIVAGHALDYNYGSVGIALLGNFNEAAPSESAVSTLIQAVAFESARHGLDPLAQINFLRVRGKAGVDTMWRDNLAVVSGHRDCLSTECPGDHLYATLPGIRQSVRDLLGDPGPSSQLTRSPADRNLWPTDLTFAWESGNSGTEFSTRLEGFKQISVPDLIQPLSGYTEDQKEIWGDWSTARQASFALPLDAVGSYTFFVRSRDANGRIGQFPARQTYFVDRHVLVDNRDRSSVERAGDWEASTETFGFNGLDYEVSTAGDLMAAFTWRLKAPEDGDYQVLGTWPTSSSPRAARYELSVNGQAGSFSDTVQDEGERWVHLGQVTLQKGEVCSVKLTSPAGEAVVADAVRLLQIRA
jgi:hypothetical protein